MNQIQQIRPDFINVKDEEIRQQIESRIGQVNAKNISHLKEILHNRFDYLKNFLELNSEGYDDIEKSKEKINNNDIKEIDFIVNYDLFKYDDTKKDIALQFLLSSDDIYSNGYDPEVLKEAFLETFGIELTKEELENEIRMFIEPEIKSKGKKI